MDQLILDKIIRYEGCDFLGRYACLTLEPNLKQTGWVWNVGDHDVPITPDIMVSKPRRVALTYGEHELNEFEHIGILRAAGLQHVRIGTSRKKGWPPYDGGSLALWQAVMPYVHKEGALEPYRASVLHTSYALPKDRSRMVTYIGDGNDYNVLRMTGLVDFPSIQKEIYRFGHVYPNDDLRELVRARTLGWPPVLRNVSWIASKLGWPHHGRIVWPQDASPQEVLDEIGRHRLQDALGILNFAAPTGTYLAGGFHSCKGNHATDLGLLKQIISPKIVRFGQHAA